ncbi:MAG TPA: GDP-mannose 4,6-dehydratase [Chitinophagaceae bacterium]
MKNKNVIIFGANGQDGYYLNMLLFQQGYKVIKVSRNGSHINADVSDYKLVDDLIKQYQPEFIFHFAANSSTKHETLFDNHNAISTGTLNILESVRLSCPAAKVFISGSAMQFKNDGKPINEQTPFEPGSPYSVARIHSVYAARYYRNTFGLMIYTGYFFNHDSPLRTEKHVNQKIVKAANRIASGSNEKLELGNIQVQKEFNYAGDVVQAVWQLVNQHTIFEAVIGCGEVHTIQEWLVYCFAQKNIDWRKFVILQKDFVSEYNILVSNPALIKSIGWQPKVNFYQLANMMLNE